MTILKATDLKKVFYDGDGNNLITAVSGVTFDVAEREFLCIVGTSGSGKTTLVKMLAGLLAPTQGTITIDGNLLVKPPEGLTMVFQDYNRSLFPWLRVTENVIAGMNNHRLDKHLKATRAREYLEMVGLKDFTEFYPWELSGGMQQRVAIARALARQPKILIMDEPFGSLDALTRFELEDELLKLWKRLGITVILVTHDIDEAIYLSDRVLVMTRPQQAVVGEFRTILPRPRVQLETRGLSEFISLRNQIHSLFRSTWAVASTL